MNCDFKNVCETLMRGDSKMTDRFVYGTYLSANELHEVVNELIMRGVDPHAISLVANQSIVRRLDTNLDVINYDEYIDQGNSSGWLDKIFGNKDSQLQTGVDLLSYEDEIAEDYILVVVDTLYEGEAYKLGVANESTPGISENYEEEVEDEDDEMIVASEESLATDETLSKNSEDIDEVIDREELEDNYQERINSENSSVDMPESSE